MKTAAMCAFAFCTLAGCGSSSGAPAICAAPAIPTMQLTSPVNGSTSVLATIGQLDFTASFAVNPAPTVILASASGRIVEVAVAGLGATITIGLPGGSSGPTPVPTLTPMPLVAYTAALPTLTAATTYIVTATYGSANPQSACPTVFNFNLGTFTTI